jgi:hypothetical protein
MVKKSVVQEIDRVIKDVWMKNIPKDYHENYLINEDSSKSTEDWIKDDLKKLKEYASYKPLQCPLYFAIISKNSNLKYINTRIPSST